MDNTELARSIREFKEKELYLYKLQKKYNDQMGLSIGGASSNTQRHTINLPLHPTSLQKELDDYKDYAEKLEGVLLERETKEKFLRLVLNQDAPHQVTQSEFEVADKRASELEHRIQSSQNEIDGLKSTLQQRATRVEELHVSISLKADALSRVIEEIKENSEALQQVEAQLAQQTGVPLEEAMQVEEQLTNDIIEINTDIDDRRDRMAQMNREAAEKQRAVDELEKRLEDLKQEASGRQLYDEEHNRKIEETTHWYQTVLQEQHDMVGIDDFVTTPNGLIVHFANDHKDELLIEIKNHKFENASVTSQDCQIEDLVQVAKSHHDLDDSITTIVYGTLARLKNIA
ncbi:hypothetical protein BDB00DRAFT_819137 [Zychaea mexicana]|uniref:uncharacterized protein n=1 Tax=Zychaea mexicana TaxID=64656 RepID=UPI0022FEB54B|nr:uncharacterized protein BDB00DRAFT_819137 [Zychaea mexicana]KAI9494429.1 hypothetical protein BDB00DRAFT_819137 [Zychaea mexicana]